MSPVGMAMVRLRLHEIMKARGITAYALTQGTTLSYPTAYRLSRRKGTFQRLQADTLSELCRYFQLPPGELLEWVPEP